MNPKTQIISYFNIFPTIRDFFFLDTEDNIKQFKTTIIKDPEYIFVIYESKKEEKTCENIYRRKDFLSDYEFIRVNTDNPNIYINFIIPKNKFNKQREIRLLTEIKQRKKSFMEEIFAKTKINFDTKDSIVFKESFSIQNELKFYNRVFYLFITKQNFVPAPFNQRVNNNNSFAFNNTNNNNYQNNNFNKGNNNNNIFYNGGSNIINNFNKNNNPVKILQNRNPLFNIDNNQDMNFENPEFINNNSK